MKTLNFYKYLPILGLFSILTSCESFLDKQEDEALTFDKIWETMGNTRKYWLNTMSFLPDDTGDWGDIPWAVATDEAVFMPSRTGQSINTGSWNPTNVPEDSNYDVIYDKYYKGIRECNVFLQNVDRCKDPKATPEMKEQWKANTRFARVYYYFMLMRLYGPVILIGDEIIDATAPTEYLYRPRNTWKECVDYVVCELNELIDNPAVTDGWNNDTDKGLATKGACQAIISRLKLYSARDLYNGNTLYAGLKNPDGNNLFPVEYNAELWLDAAKAARVIIDNHIYKLYRKGNNDPYEDYYGMIWSPWNSELIWTTGYKSGNKCGYRTAPTALGGGAYGSSGVSQKQVDAYAMKNGVYPITGYKENGEPIIDENSGYTEGTKSAWEYPKWVGTSVPKGTEMPDMFKDREPRFYVTVFFSGTEWKYGTNKKMISFAKGGNSNKSHDQTRSGYMVNKFYDHTSNSVSGQWGNLTFPTFRLGEIYLNFIESVLECKKRGVAMPGDYEQKAMEVWNDLRDRAGMKPIKEIYPNASVDELIQLCRRERQIELAYENHRYFDTRTWMISKQEDAGPVYGMNIEAPANGSENTPDDFWKRTVVETRVFKDNFYLFPFAQGELERNRLLVQNYGW